MSSHEGEPDKSILRGACRRNHRVDEYTVLERLCCNDEGLLKIPYVQRDNRTFSVSDLEAGLTETCEGVIGNFPKSLDALRFILDDMKGFKSCCSSCRGAGSAEDVSSGSVTQIIDNHLVGCNETTD